MSRTNDLKILQNEFLLRSWKHFERVNEVISFPEYFFASSWIFTEQLTLFVLPLIYYERFYSISDSPEEVRVNICGFRISIRILFPSSSLNGGSQGVTILIKLLALTSNKFYVPHKTCELTLRRRSKMCIVVGSEHPLSDQGPLN